MGRVSAAQTCARMYAALLEQRTWSQSDLAKALGLNTQTVRKHLLALQGEGVPLERDEEHPHVYWSVPSTWFPSGHLLTDEQLALLARHVARHPKTETRERLLSQLLRAVPESPIPSAHSLAIDERLLTLLEDAAADRVAVHVRYFSASRGDQSHRHVSIHRLEYIPTVRFVATCHRDDVLKWFRADRAAEPKRDLTEPFRQSPPELVATFIRESFHGHRSERRPKRVEFTIRWPEGRWAIRELPQHATVHYESDHASIQLETAGLDSLARHLVGLGHLASAKTPILRKRILALATGALTTNSPTDKVNDGSVSPKRQGE